MLTQNSCQEPYDSLIILFFRSFQRGIYRFAVDEGKTHGRRTGNKVELETKKLRVRTKEMQRENEVVSTMVGTNVLS